MFWGRLACDQWHVKICYVDTVLYLQLNRVSLPCHGGVIIVCLSRTIGIRNGNGARERGQWVSRSRELCVCLETFDTTPESNVVVLFKVHLHLSNANIIANFFL